MKDTIFQMCFYMTIGMIAFALLFTLFVGVAVFTDSKEDAPEEGITIDTSGKENAFYSISKQDLQKSLLLSSLGGSVIGLVVGVGLSWLTRTTNGIGVGLFTGVFWTGFFNLNNIINMGNYLADSGILLIINVILCFMFVGAIIGMFTGSG